MTDETKMRTLMTETTEMIIVGNRLRHRSLARSIVLKKHRKNKKPQVNRLRLGCSDELICGPYTLSLMNVER